MLELPRKSNPVDFPEVLAVSMQLPENISKCDQLEWREMPCFSGNWSFGREDRNNGAVLFGNYLYCAHKWTTLCYCCVRQSSEGQVGVQTFLLLHKQSGLHNWTCLSPVLDVFFHFNYCIYVVIHISTGCTSCFFQGLPLPDIHPFASWHAVALHRISRRYNEPQTPEARCAAATHRQAPAGSCTVCC